MDTGGFASCGACREYRWISDRSSGANRGLCVECLQRASEALRVAPSAEPPEPPKGRESADAPAAPEQKSTHGSAAKDVRKKVERKYDKGKLGAKPKRAILAELARALWDDLSPPDRKRLADDLRALGFEAEDPFEATVDFCEVTVLKRRNALKKAKKTAKQAAQAAAR
jgi:hypothetical protein